MIHAHPDIVAMISALRDEMATRFNALADEVDKMRTNTITEKSVENASENWNTCTCGHHGSAHDLRNRCLVEGCPCRCFSTIRKSLPESDVDAVVEKKDESVRLIDIEDRLAIKALKTDFRHVLEALNALSLKDDPLVDAPLMTDMMRFRVDKLIGDL